MNQPKNRIRLIDLCRGVLVLMMTARHTISIMQISHEHWLYKYFLPSGWATVCFISLSGFTIGMLFLTPIQNPATQKPTELRLRKRSWQLLVVMFFSNLLMLISKLAVQGDIDLLYEPSWWLGLVTLKTPYSISSILIPTALMVFLAPEVLHAIVQYKALPVLGVSLSLAVTVAILGSSLGDPEELHYLLRRLFFEGDGFFPLLPMVLYGISSIAVGSMWNTHVTSIISVTIATYYVLLQFKTHSPAAQVLFEAIAGPERLVIVNAVCLVLMKLPFWQPITGFLATIGRFSLLSFLLHRILLQALTIAIEIIQPAVAFEIIYFFLVTANMMGIWLVCVSRLRYPKWNAFIRKLYI